METFVCLHVEPGPVKGCPGCKIAPCETCSTSVDVGHFWPGGDRSLRQNICVPCFDKMVAKALMPRASA